MVSGLLALHEAPLTSNILEQGTMGHYRGSACHTDFLCTPNVFGALVSGRVRGVRVFVGVVVLGLYGWLLVFF